MSTVNQSIMPLTAKVNELGNLEIGGCDVVDLAEKYRTPLYVYDESTITECCKQYKSAFASYSNNLMLFASKAFMTKAMCCILKAQNFGLDVVSGGEIYTAHKAGFPMENVFFNGNNKTSEELELALEVGVGRVTVDNFLEIDLLNSIAQSKNQKVNILLRITPGIECHTHEYIQTGHLDSKFGFDLTQLEEAITIITNECPNLVLKGLHAHVGSQIFETQVYYDAVKIILEQFAKIKKDFNINLEEMNVGGGLGVKYTEADKPPSINTIADVIIDSVNENAKKLGLSTPKLIIEPGRSIICNAGVTLYTVGSSKQVPNGGKKYVALDGGMADNPRPSMYQALYCASVANNMNGCDKEVVTLAGRYCESGDILIKDVELPKLEPGDIVVVYATGAYNYSMASNYNRVQKPEAILVQNGQSDVIIKRESYDDLIANDVIPERFS